MILFLYGEEPYLVRDKLHQVVGKARSQGIDVANSAELDSTADVRAIREAVMAVPFISKQRLVVLRNWLLERTAFDTEQLSALLKDVPETTILAIAEFGVPDKRRGGFKALQKAADKTWEFGRLAEPAAASWARQHAGSLRADLPNPIALHLVHLSGTDLWGLATDVEKLASAASGPITVELIDQLVADASPADIFALVDAIGRRDVKTAMTQLRRLAEEGEPALRVFAMVVRQFRILIGAGALAAQGQNEAAVAKELHLHPFVAQKALAQSKSFTESELRQLFDELAELDFQIKTGAQDADPALELFVVGACSAEARVT